MHAHHLAMNVMIISGEIFSGKPAELPGLCVDWVAEHVVKREVVGERHLVLFAFFHPLLQLGAQVAHNHRPLVPLISETSDQLLVAFKLPTKCLNLVLKFSLLGLLRCKIGLQNLQI